MTKKYRIGLYGGLGDVLMHTPILKALKQREPSAKIILYGNRISRELFLHNPNVDQFIVYNTFARMLYRIRLYARVPNQVSLAYGMLQPSLQFRGSHAIEIMARMLGLSLEDKQVQIYLTQQEDSEAKKRLAQYPNPVLIQITSRSSSNQNWPIEKWQELIRAAPEFTFIQVGSTDEEYVDGAINLLGKTSIRETLALLKNVGSFVAVDSFLNNASNAFLVNGCVLFGPSPPDIWGYPHNINIFKDPKCGPCIDTIRNNPCPYGKTCMNEISVQEVKQALHIQFDSIQPPI